ncbi:MAG: hypothetical protein HQ549_01015 [Candidatus Omnitrophica bacterium]|nr:hypothetical protein [Candidatus Omnitrophota bacterium]
MAKIPKEIKTFKILFIIIVTYQLVGILSRPAFLNLHTKGIGSIKGDSIIVAIGFLIGVIYIIFLWYLHSSTKILKLNDIIKIKPWIFIVCQIILTGGLILPGMVIPIFVWIKSKKLLTLDTIKTYDEKKFMLPQSKRAV